MAPLPPVEERPIRALGARRRAPPLPAVEEIVRSLREMVPQTQGLVAVLDADGVAGERHLLSAWAHLGRSRSRGAARLRDRSAEFVLYVAGDDQLPRALAKIGVGPSTERFVVVAERPLEPESLLERFGLVADPQAYPRPIRSETLDRLGIDADDRASVPPASWEGLVLERVAMVDLGAPPGRPATPKP
jgi:tRNA threonylcarbamoyladenosine modification (KEOPS) complex Cgi121 subunit